MPRVCVEIYELAADAEGLTLVETDLNPFTGGDSEIPMSKNVGNRPLT